MKELPGHVGLFVGTPQAAAHLGYMFFPPPAHRVLFHILIKLVIVPISNSPIRPRPVCGSGDKRLRFSVNGSVFRSGSGIRSSRPCVFRGCT